MNKTELVSVVASQTNFKKSTVSTILDSILNNIKNNTREGKKTELVGFGGFSRVHRKGRKGRNPQTGKPLKIAARDVPKFKPGTPFKKLVNQNPNA